MNPDLAESIRAVLLADSTISDQLADHLDSKAIFTREPAPGEAVYPMIVISRNTSTEDEDGLNDYRPIAVYNIRACALHETPANYRIASDLGYRIRNRLHGQRNLSTDGWATVRQTCRGPVEQPGVEQTTERMVTLSVLLAQSTAPIVVVPSPDHLLLSSGDDLLSTEGDLITLAGV